ncbi:peptide ABC transporter ATPase [Pseudonocardia sp. EC080610-09]|uniref:dipeptide ABC transporter ATP-binding protein n=1 Tax=unclassified Pseudonocardia TaxID=2619320 RepID=UPI0006CB56E8|nr:MULTISPECIES: ABC transporter ATP-binding protein [unclassified Pseudonocardia]ALE72870.1 peptide ABC transporter ATPase [Pseudonocardia sp. EC080625-04]ALL76194.1 peptide ABC transporter ATPase [Pseudonocardia sp. EC080610-09]ALL83219.1 peptide ABC transporter ATPase [Pseudonocardia sp. EC080619-01]
MTPVLTISDLRVSFGGTAAVDGVDLTVRRGEVVALVGESGSGKTLTARSVLGLLPGTATATGSVSLDGRPVLGASEQELDALRGSSAAMVFQEPQTALNPVRTVGWQLVEALRATSAVPRADARARAVELLELVGLPEPERRVRAYPHQLSGGQKQRVVIALALAGEPDLLLADEPTTALDVTVQAQILDLLRDLRDRTGVGVLLVTHNMGVVAELADRVVVMHRGRVVEQRPVAELFARPATDYTRELLAAVPSLGDRRAAPRPPDDPARGAGVRAAGAADRPGPAADPTVPGPRPSGPDGPVLALEELSILYPARRGRPAFRAVHEVSVAVHPGEVVGLVGESGSGKTTIGRAAVGLLPASGGRVLLDGADLARLPRAALRRARRGLAMVHQDPAASLDPRQSVGESVAEPLRVHGTRPGPELERRVGELLESVRLPRAFAARRPGELSGGQRQRVALARALSLSPRLLIADEPTSALDVSVQADVLELFAGLQRELGFACLFVSHDLAVVERVADRVAVLRAGELLELGPPAQVFGAPAHDYSRRLVDAVPRVPARP